MIALVGLAVLPLFLWMRETAPLAEQATRRGSRRG